MPLGCGRVHSSRFSHDSHEQRTGQRDEEWPAWYAAYLLTEQTGAELAT
jgi:hypothetical protein